MNNNKDRLRVLLLTIATGASATAVAQFYPSKPLRMILPAASGDVPDIAARIFASELTASLGQQVIVENRPGASHFIAYESVARAAPDGYTIGYVTNVLATNPSLHAKLPYDSARDFQPLIHTGSNPLLMVGTLSQPIRSVKELLEHARAKPGALSYGSPGVGLGGHLAMELLKQATNTNIVHVPYKGVQQAITDVISGQIHVSCAAVGAILPHVHAGRVRTLGITSKMRLAILPDTPTVDEAGVPGFEYIAWGGLVLPAKVPRQIAQRLNTEMNRVVHLPAVAKAALARGGVPKGGTPEQFADFISAETVKWAKVINAAGIKPQ